MATPFVRRGRLRTMRESKLRRPSYLLTPHYSISQTMTPVDNVGKPMPNSNLLRNALIVCLIIAVALSTMVLSACTATQPVLPIAPVLTPEQKREPIPFPSPPKGKPSLPSGSGPIS